MKRHGFVTGATGFLGRNLVEELTRQEWEITKLCLPTDKTESLMRPEVQIVIGSLTDLASLLTAMPTAPRRRISPRGEHELVVCT